LCGFQFACGVLQIPGQVVDQGEREARLCRLRRPSLGLPDPRGTLFLPAELKLDQSQPQQGRGCRGRQAVRDAGHDQGAVRVADLLVQAGDLFRDRSRAWRRGPLQTTE
jgi:hypothetical protein